MGETCSCDRGDVKETEGEEDPGNYNTEKINDQLLMGDTAGAMKSDRRGILDDESESSSRTASDIRSKTAALLTAGESDYSEGKHKPFGVVITRQSDTSGAETDPLDSTEEEEDDDDDDEVEQSDEELDDADLMAKQRAIKQMGALIRLSAQGQSLDIETIANKGSNKKKETQKSLDMITARSSLKKKKQESMTDQLIDADGKFVEFDSSLYEEQDSDEDDEDDLGPGGTSATGKSAFDASRSEAIASQESLLAMSAYKIHPPISTASIEIRFGVVYFDKDLPDLGMAGSSGVGGRSDSYRQRSISRSTSSSSKKKRDIKLKVNYKQSAVSSTRGVPKKLSDKSEWHSSRGYDGDIIDIRESINFPLFANGTTALPVLFKRQASSLASAATGLVWRVKNNLEIEVKQKTGKMKKDKFVGYASFPIEDYMDSGLLSRDGDWTQPINLEFFKTAEQAGFAKEMKKLAKKQAKAASKSKRKGSIVKSQRRGSKPGGSKLTKGSSSSSVISLESNDSDMKVDSSARVSASAASIGSGGSSGGGSAYLEEEDGAPRDGSDDEFNMESGLGTIDELDDQDSGASSSSVKREGFIQMEARLFWPPSVMEEFHKYTAEEASKTTYTTLKGGSSPGSTTTAAATDAKDSQVPPASPSIDTSISTMLSSDFGPIAFMAKYHAQLKVTILGVLFAKDNLQDWDYMSLKNLTNTLQTLGVHSELYKDEISGVSLTGQRKIEDNLKETYSSEEFSSKSSDVVFVGNEWLFNLTKYKITETSSMGSMGLSMHPQSSFILNTNEVNKNPGSILITVIHRDTSMDHVSKRAIDRRMSKRNIGCSLIKIESLIKGCSISMGSKVSDEQLFIQPMFVPIEDVTNRKLVKETSKKAPIQNGAIFCKYQFQWSRKMK